MNDWKCAITLAICCCITLTVAPSASADFVGVTSITPDDPDTVLLCTEGNGTFVPGPLTVCDVFAVFDDPDDTLLGVGNAELQVYNGQIPDLFYHHPAGGNSPRSPCCECIEPRFFGFPDLICDSYITIGLKCGELEPADGTTPDDDFVLIEFLQNGHVVGGWFNEDPFNGQGDAGTWPDLHVLFLQSSVIQGHSMSGHIDVFWRDGDTGEVVAEVDVPIECAAECGSCPTDSDADGDTDAADLAALLGVWGPVNAGDCQDADDNGLIDAFDLAVLLGNWGPCL